MRTARPPVWFLLNLPFGATSGFIMVTMGFIAKQAGLSDTAIAGLVAANILPHTWKFFWAPIADITLTRKRWYVLANAVSCATIGVLAFVPIRGEWIWLLELLIFLNGVAISFLGMAVEGLMAHATPPAQIGRAAGWFQAGNLGGSGMGGGLALMVAEHVSERGAFVVLALLLAACTASLRLVPEAPRVEVPGAASLWTQVRAQLRTVARDLWRMLASRRGIVALVLCSIPAGSGAAQGLFSAIAGRWGASGTLVAVTTGLVGGVAALLGCLAGGWLSDRMNRRVAYAVAGLILAGFAAGMGLAPRTPVTYAIFTLLYSFGAGIAYACFTGFVLEVIGKGAVATKYNALASLSNIPIWYMTLVDGWASETHGPVTMLYVDAGAAVAGVIFLLLVVAIVRPGRTPVAAEPPAGDGPAPA